ncbi:phage adaptor protein [Mesorhizobium caraganae]|uniref:phage adaptor protein n=1 Tax=Mesorhizobium caraganae TaxID=483206 RepID=UPI00177D8A12|nr:hypothetical protein [Mesorhizobium caraganae]
MTALELLQRTVRLLGITSPPTSLVGTDDDQITNLLEILTDVGQDIASRHDWSKLAGTFSFVSDGNNSQSAPFASDWSRSFPNASVWRSGSLLVPLSGPCPPDIWHRLLTLPGIRFPGYWRMFGGEIEIIGVPASETVSVEYVSDAWVIDADDGSFKDTVSKDGDTFRIPDRLLRLAVIWQWRSFKGLSYAEEMSTFEKQLERDIAADRSARPMSTTTPYVPDARNLAWPGLVVVSP